MKEKVLHTRAVYTSQTGDIVAEEIGDILDQFNIKDTVAAVTVDNAVKKMSMKKNVLLCSHSRFCCSEALNNTLNLTMGRKDQSNGVAEMIQPG